MSQIDILKSKFILGFKTKFRPGKYLIFPKTQIKYAFISSAVSGIALLSVMTIQHYFFIQVAQCSEQNLLNIARYSYSLSVFNSFVFLTSTGLAFFASILITHRFLGPIVAIQRSLNAYKVDKTFKKITIRKTDELHHLVGHLNEVLGSIDEKK